MNTQVSASSSNITAVTYGVRDSATWPRHRTKAKSRKARRVSIARAGQRDRDAVRGGQ